MCSLQAKCYASRLRKYSVVLLKILHQNLDRCSKLCSKLFTI